ncbi:MAG: DUF2855 family protein [Hyphomonadaceae bacterium]
MATDLLVKRGALRERRFAATPAPEVGPGQALLKVDSFALTANTVTYAAFGDAMRYWDFFPAPEAERAAWGRVPCWGFAEVVASNAEGVPVGQRYYGYYPIGTHLLVEPKPRGQGFVDLAAHRQALPGVYNAYERVNRADAESEAMAMLFRPLFTTSFVLDDFFADQNFFGAKRVILSSASSKTALGMAWLMRRRGTVEVTALTSRTNAPFVEKTGAYDRIVAYEDVASLDANEPAAYCDFSGSAGVRAAVHQHFGDKLMYDCAVGAADWSSGGELPADLPGPAPQFFFAPTQIEKRIAEWGPQQFGAKLSEATNAFFAAARPWMRIVRGDGRDAVDKSWIDTVDGRVAPEDGLILRL